MHKTAVSGCDHQDSKPVGMVGERLIVDCNQCGQQVLVALKKVRLQVMVRR